MMPGISAIPPASMISGASLPTSPIATMRPSRMALEEWVAERFRRHAGNADVVRQELEREKGIAAVDDCAEQHGCREHETGYPELRWLRQRRSAVRGRR
jgi:hypothetical protein